MAAATRIPSAASAGLALLAFCAQAAPQPTAEPSRRERLARALSLEAQRAPGNALGALLADSDPGVRRRAALAAGRLGDTSAVPMVLSLLGDVDSEVRQMAAFSLGLLGSPAAREPLQIALGDPSPTVRARSVEALGRLGDPRAAAAVIDFIRRTTPANAPILTIRGDDPGSPIDPWLELRLALFALVRLQDASAAAQILLSEGRPRYDWWAATWTAMRLDSPTLRPVLVAALRSDDPLSRSLAARGLGRLRDRESVTLLTGATRDPVEAVVIEALRALGSIGDAEGTGPVLAALGTRSPTTRAAALRALAQLPPRPGLQNRVLNSLGDVDNDVRAAAYDALVHLDPEGLPLILSGLDPDPDWRVRAELSSALGLLKGEIPASLLHARLAESEPRVLESVLSALAKTRGADAVPTLVQHLQHPDEGVRIAAAQALGELKAPQASAALVHSWKSSAGSPVAVRVVLAEALAALGSGPAREALSAAQDDPDRQVRRRIRTLLGLDALAGGGVVTGEPTADQISALAPYDPELAGGARTPRAFIVTRVGRIEIHLNVVEAPVATRNFIDLARRGYFDGLPFHRVIPAFVAQAGDPRGDGIGGPGYTVPCEIGQRPFGKGALGMAHAGKDTGGSQFFLTLSPQPHLDGVHTQFGVAVSDLEVLDKIRPGDLIDRVEIWDGR